MYVSYKYLFLIVLYLFLCSLYILGLATKIPENPPFWQPSGPKHAG
jgi:hypothetical protein